MSTLHHTVPRGLSVALYKGTRPGLSGLYNRVGRFLDRGPYSHCEVVFSDGLSGSSSFMDKGVRLKQINYTSVGHWDFLPIPDPNGNLERTARQWMYNMSGKGYDVWGNVRFFCGLARDSADKYFCSEATMSMLAFAEAYRFGPSGMAALLLRVFNTRIIEVPLHG